MVSRSNPCLVAVSVRFLTNERRELTVLTNQRIIVQSGESININDQSDESIKRIAKSEAGIIPEGLLTLLVKEGLVTRPPSLLELLQLSGFVGIHHLLHHLLHQLLVAPLAVLGV